MKRIDNNTIEKLVFNLRKPARYLGNEINQVVKENPVIRMAISYPDLYEIGMSNNGIRILYNIANSMDEVACERVFAVERDFEEKAKKSGIPLYTLETYMPLSELDLIGFNISHELLFTNILQILDMGNVPVYRKDRDDRHPIIIAGGESVSNPAPLLGFIDAFFIGDGEEGITDILNLFLSAKKNSQNRKQIITLMQDIEGILLPDNLGSEKKIKKRTYRGTELLNPKKPIIPNIRITQEKLVVEVARGCKNLCKFCHAGYFDLPYRHYDPREIGDQVLKLTEYNYYNELTLSSLSISDYRHLIKLINYIMPAIIEKGISISLPSLRVDINTLKIIENISDLRKTSLTFAVESACDEIRAISNKKLRINELISIAEYVFKNGWNQIKLYFMIGLPGCEEHDEADSIVSLLRTLSHVGGRNRKINVTISPFVPKPHTPFQWEKQMDSEYFLNTILKIKKGVPKRISIKSHDVNASLLEGILSRGDELLGDVIYSSYMDGCRLDSWSEYFNYGAWMKNLDKIIPDWKKYLYSRNISERLPWDTVTTGYEKLICSFKEKNNLNSTSKSFDPDDILDTESIHGAVDLFKQKFLQKQRIRITLEKTDYAKYIPHLDFIEIIKRALRMAHVPVSFTQGYNKREKLALGYPVPLGIESKCELCDIDLYDTCTEKNLINDLRDKFPKGINIIDVKTLTENKSVMSIISIIEYSITIPDKEIMGRCIKNLENEISFNKKTRNGEKLINFDDAIFSYSIEEQESDPENNIIRIKTWIGSKDSMRIDNLALSLAEMNYDEFYKFKITKECQYKMIGNVSEKI